MLTEKSRRDDFPSLAGRAYLNTAAEGIPPPSVRQALLAYAADKLLGMDGRKLHEEQRISLKRRAAEMMGLDEEEIGLCSCASEAYNLLALALQLTDGDEVVINDLDFPAGVSPWLQSTCPATVRLWRARSGILDLHDLASLLSSRTRLVTTSLVSFYNGFRIAVGPLAAVVRRSSPALLAVDVTQGLGRISIDVADADFVVSSTHKWLLGVHGGGIVGVTGRRAAEITVPAGGWFHLEAPFADSRFESAASQPGAASFSVGMPNYPAIYANRAALDYLAWVTVRAIESHSDPLVDHCITEMAKLPLELLTPSDRASRAGIVAFRHPAAERLAAYFQSRNIHVMHNAGRIRIALHAYNTPSDVTAFLAALNEGIRHG